ncbi:metallophosphoesterase [Vibrio ulleungensis]|uniref:Metallophosphoesterase n=1 Tax=Vibrio ulleungensis TaxID=2807619 RepID=A0ABS2HDE8_9VIBR|nr:metallophosphoesterase [Vibrio ulleungensis]MBM7035096.1 metallophosphoesterase [Vibrio ulleungensis]
MKRRDLLKGLSTLPVVLSPLAIGCKYIRDEAKNTAHYYLEPGEGNFGLDRYFNPLDELLPLPNDTINLVILGDSGMGNAEQQRVADNIADYHALYPVDAMIHTGDIIYPDGILDAQDPQAYTKFEHIYANPRLTKSDGSYIPMIGSLGNHDHYGDPQALIDFANQHSEVLAMPSRFFKVTQTQISDSNLNVDIYVLDSYPFIKNRYCLDQIAWLDKELRESTADHKIIVTHHPIRVYGQYEDNQYLVDTIGALAKQYNVTLCAAGHDHHLQLIESFDGTTYMVSGGGGGSLRKSGVGDGSVFSAPQYGAIAMQISSEGVRYIPIIEFDQTYPDYAYYQG